MITQSSQKTTEMQSKFGLLIRLLSGVCFFCVSVTSSYAQTATQSDWIQFPPRVTPRQSVPHPVDSKAELIQFPPVPSLSMGTKSASTYRGNTQTYVVTFGDGTTTTVTEKAVSQQVSWGADHVTKITTYKFADGSSFIEHQTIQGVTRPPTYKGAQQIIVTDYADGTSASLVNAPTDQRRAWTDDHTARIDTYTFADGSIHQDIQSVTLLKKKSTYSGSTQEILYTYSDGSSEVKKFPAVASVESWAADHQTRLTKHTFQDGSVSREVEKFEPSVASARYIGDKKLLSTKYPDGHVKEHTQQATSQAVTWSDDKRIKTIQYKFPDGTHHVEELRVDAVLVKSDYEQDLEIHTYKLGDGSTEIKKSKAISQTEEWARDHTTKLTHYKFSSGKVNTVKTTVAPIRSVVSYDRNLQYVTIRYGDGAVDSQINQAVSESVVWGDDHMTKEIRYKFKDGSMSRSLETVLPKRLAPIYSQDEQIIVTQYADGHQSREVNKSISQKTEWSPEKTQRKITHVFPDGSLHVDEQFIGVSGTLVSKDVASQAVGKATNPFVLKGIRFKGNTRLTSEILEASIKPWIGREVDFASLQNAAALIVSLYQEDGVLAKVEIPQQEVKNGIVMISVAEATLASVALRNQLLANSVSQHAQKVVEATNPVGDFVDLKKLDKAALLLNEIPGIHADLTLKPGRDPKETDVIIDVEEGKALDGSISVDNNGARSTGRARTVASMNMNGLAQRGDQVNLQAMHSQGSDYIRMAYSEPLGPYGWRLGASVSDMKYQVISADSLALNAHGPASVRGLDLVGPLLKNREGSLSLQLTADDKRFHNETFAGVHSKYSAKVYGANLFGNRWDEIGRGGLTTYSLGWTTGNIDLSGSPNQADDLAGVNTAGVFNKYKLVLKREQQLGKSLTLSAAYQSQWADKNLDSSEKIFLGGPQGVRAYGTNEAGGSIGKVVNLELQNQTRASEAVWTQAIFYDVGYITVNKFNDFATAIPLNSYTLKGAGVWTGLNMKNKWGMATARLTWSRRIGINPAANGLGLDQDGTLIKDRWWLTMSQSF